MNHPDMNVVAIISRGGKHYRQHKVHDARTYRNCPGVKARYWATASDYSTFKLQDARPDADMCGFCFWGWAYRTVAEYLAFLREREQRRAA